FAEKLKPLLNGPNIKHVNMRQLRKMALKSGRKTVFGSRGWRSAVSSRIGPKTVYLGSEKVVLPRPTDLHKDIIHGAPGELENVLHVVKTLPFVHIRRQMGDNDIYNPKCNLYVSVADKKNARLAYMWSNTLREPVPGSPGPEFTLFHIPDEHQIRQQVLSIPEHDLNIALATDYMGEDKKGFLRQAMWTADEMGMMGLHAGTKLVTARDERDGKLKTYGIFLFGLSATGKSTWSCHQLGLDYKNGEMTKVCQDDIVFLKRDGGALGSENGFFVKTDVDPKLQEAMYNALVDPSALYENVMINSRGEPDFLDETLCANGRSVIQKDRLMIRQGRRKVCIQADSIDLPTLEELDGLVFAFITRRNTIMSFAQRLTAEQAVLAYLWGESTHSYASQPAKAGESARVVGTDPFIIGSRARKVNRFYDILMGLEDRYPGKIRYFQYNTGGMGEIIEKTSGGKKRMVRKADRVPIHLMAAIQRGDMRNTNRYEMGPLGVEQITSCVDGDELKKYKPENFYSAEQIQHYQNDLFEGRRQFTEEISNEGLDPMILRLAEESYGKHVMKERRPKAFLDLVEGLPKAKGPKRQKACPKRKARKGSGRAA
ncbi:MAG: phosphoenolpyruvate carboxykinase (ATP), partial [Planctomycetota bacterium]